jgi:hypothetical protein
MLNRGSVLYLTLISLFVLPGVHQTSAQLLRASLPAPPQSKTKSSDAGRTKALEAKSLPFWDDFSFADGIYPQDTLWENSKAVWITRGIGANTPSIYAATFDGVNANGNPYSPDILANGYRDTLTSRAIRLDEVPAGILGRPRTYLSFYYQWQGNGEAPEDDDYLQLDYKNTDGVWVEQFRIYPRESFDRTVFYDTIVAIGGDEFFHENFQFRFLAYGRNSGAYDTWNIDYVYLNFNRDTYPVFHPDRAIASELSSLFKQYRAIPLKHFKGNGEFDKVTLDINNFSWEPDAVGISIKGFFKNFFEDGSHTTLDDVALFDSLEFVVEGEQRTTLTTRPLPDTTSVQQFHPDATGVDIRLKAIFISEDDDDETNDSLSIGTTNPMNGSNDQIIRYHNDTISSVHHLRDFYAYDDGIPEHAVYLNGPNNVAAVEYNLVTDDSDLLIGIDIYFPQYGITSTQTMDFVVYFPNEANGLPRNEPALTVYDPALEKDTVTGFYRLNLQGLPVPKKFYIGWIAPSLGKPKIGVDVSNDSGDKIYTRVNGVWAKNEDNHHSSIMIRPVFGEADPISGVDEYSKSIVLFPNPNRGEFFVSGKHDQLSIINVNGQAIVFEEEQQDDRTKISFTSVPGLYLLRVKNGSRVTTEKFIVVP